MGIVVTPFLNRFQFKIISFCIPKVLVGNGFLKNIIKKHDMGEINEHRC